MALTRNRSASITLRLRGGLTIHELPLTQNILDIAIASAKENNAHKIIEVCLIVGDLREFVEEITQKYWDYLSKETIAEGAKIRFERVAVTAICHKCSTIFPFDWRTIDKPLCPACNCFDVALLNGTELEIKDIAIST